MTVRELIVALMNMPDPQAPVILSRDPEGTGYAPAAAVSLEHWDERQEDVTEAKPKNAVCLWPRG